MVGKTIKVLVSVALALGGGRALAEELPVIINEVLANEPGSAVALEWVEIFNRADTAVDLAGFYLVDGLDSTKLNGVTLAAGTYGILARRLTSDPGKESFESVWGDGSGVWGDAVGENYPAMTATINLRNSADTVVLVAPAGDKSTCFWAKGNDDGVSLERVRPDSPDEIGSFLPSSDINGSTPGRVNSRTPRSNDLAVDSAAITLSPVPPRHGQSFTITVPVVNVGLGHTAANTMRLFLDKNRDSVADSSEIISENNIPILAEGAFVAIDFAVDVPTFVGVQHFIAEIAEDGNLANNTVQIMIKILPERPEIVINEFMADPLPEGPGEWVELYNRTADSVDITGWLIGDSIAQSAIISDSRWLAAGGYLVVCENAAMCTGAYPFIPWELIVEINGWRTLNNSGDGVVLRDNFGYVIDSVIYNVTYGGEHSIERIHADSLSGDAGNWAACRDSAGATPGAMNSCAPRPNDLAIWAEGIVILPASLTADVQVANVGLGNTLSNELYFGLDDNENGVAEEQEVFFSVPIPSIAENDTAVVSIPFADIFWNGTKLLFFTIGEDGNTINNTAWIAYRLPSSSSEIVINEYLPDPLPGKSEEWIELFNCTDKDIDLAGWQIGDSVNLAVISEELTPIAGGAYRVLCENRAALTMTYPWSVSDAIVEVADWRSLNNSGDKIILRDNYGFVVDSLSFSLTFDGERSVERINPAAPSNDSENWWGSVDTAGATPGMKNSTAVGYSQTLEVSILPNPFVRGQLVEICCSVPLQTTLSVGVYDINGRKVKTLLDDQPTASGMMAWNGTDDDGQLLAPGVYVMYCQTAAGASRKIVLAVAPAD